MGHGTVTLSYFAQWSLVRRYQPDWITRTHRASRPSFGSHGCGTGCLSNRTSLYSTVSTFAATGGAAALVVFDSRTTFPRASVHAIAKAKTRPHSQIIRPGRRAIGVPPC